MGQYAGIGTGVGAGIGALFGGVGAPVGAALGGAIGGAVDASQAQNHQSYQNTADMFGGPRVRSEMLEGQGLSSGEAPAAQSSVGPDLLEYLKEMKPHEEQGTPFEPLATGAAGFGADRGLPEGLHKYGTKPAAGERSLSGF